MIGNIYSLSECHSLLGCHSLSWCHSCECRNLNPSLYCHSCECRNLKSPSNNKTHEIPAFAGMTAILFILFFLISCDEVHVAPTPEPVDLLPLSIGNYWIFDTYSLDQAGNPIGGTNATDSIVAEYKDSLFGKEAYYLVRYRDSERFDTMIVAKNAKLVYMLYNEGNSGIPGLERQWFPIADLVNEFWHVYTFQKSYFPYIFNGENVVSTADYNMNEYRQAADSIDIPSAGRFYHMEFYLKTDTRIRFTYKFAGEDDSSTVERTQLQYHRISFADKVGFLMIKDDPYFYKITSTSIHYKGESKNYNGTRSDMKRYRVK